MNRWLMKSEPHVYSIDDLKRDRTTGWSGVRNYQARNFMRAMAVGDPVLFYHSNAEPSGLAGIAEVCRAAYPDPTQFDRKSEYYELRATREKPVWFQVDLRFARKLPRLLALGELRARKELARMALFTRARLSVQPVAEAEWKAIVSPP
ncbi:MAG: EVE domain-containing protein [Elusimicrobia bacterium]|nr:EVE domain-containing protein [Elusimicrobiota bacterium]